MPEKSIEIELFLASERLSDEDIKDTILHKLARHGFWGGKHTDVEELKKGFKPELLGKRGLKRVEHSALQLIREGLIIPKRVGYGSGLHVSLNPSFSTQIEHRIEHFLKRRFE